MPIIVTFTQPAPDTLRAVLADASGTVLDIFEANNATTLLNLLTQSLEYRL